MMITIVPYMTALRSLAIGCAVCLGSSAALAQQTETCVSGFAAYDGVFQTSCGGTKTCWSLKSSGATGGVDASRWGYPDWNVQCTMQQLQLHALCPAGYTDYTGLYTTPCNGTKTCWSPAMGAQGGVDASRYGYGGQNVQCTGDQPVRLGPSYSTPTTPPVATVTSDNAYYSLSTSSYWAYNSTWGTPSGTTHTQTISVYAGWPSGTMMSWSFPNNGSPSGIWSYPAIQYGSTDGNSWYGTDGTVKPYGGLPPSPTQISNLNMTVDYSVILSDPNAAGHDVIFDSYTTPAPPNGAATVKNIEVSYYVYTPPGMLNAIHDPSRQQFLYVSAVDGSSVYHRLGSTQYNWVPQNGQQLSGTVRWGALLKEAATHGVLSATDYLSGMALGPEVITGSGSITINSVSYNW